MSKEQPSIADRSLISLTWPIFFDLFFIFMINVTDALFLSQVSDDAAAAVGAMLPILGIGFALYSTIQQAGSSIATQQLGAKDHNKVAGTYGVLILLILFSGLCMSVTFVSGANTFPDLLGLTSELSSVAQIYLTTLGMGTWILALRFSATAILASQGKTNWNMFSTAIMSVVNIIFNYILIDGKFGAPALGVQGIATASVIAWSSSLLFSLSIILWHFKIGIYFPIHWQTFKNYCRPILKIAIPSIVEPLSWQLSQLLMTTMAVTMGTLSLATRIYSFNLLFIGILYSFAISSGVQIKVAFLIGGNRFDDAQNELLKGIKIGVIGVLVFMTVLVSYSQYFYSFFTDNKEIWVLGSTVLFIGFLGELGRSFNLIVGASLRACGDARYTSIVGVVSMWFIGVPLAWFLGLNLAWGLAGIWLATSIDDVFRGMSNMHRWNTKKWQSKGLYAKTNKKTNKQ